MDEYDYPPPHQNAHQIGREALEPRLRASMAEGALSHGWIISGASGSGKATLAYRIARGLLEPSALCDDQSFEMSVDARAFHLIGAQSHPDLFVAQRLWDEKKSKYQTEISVETIRKLTSFMSRTASFGGWRVAIIDTADDMNRNAANALLKVLEEPPKKTLLLLLASRPGRLLATIRSRCRHIALEPLADELIQNFLISSGIEAAAAKRITEFAKGRPGYALRLARGEGGDAIGLAQKFLTAAMQGKDIAPIIARLSKRDADELWDVFQDALEAMLVSKARGAATDGQSAASLVDAWEHSTALLARGQALNLDRGQLLNALHFDLGARLRANKAA